MLGEAVLGSSLGPASNDASARCGSEGELSSAGCFCCCFADGWPLLLSVLPLCSAEELAASLDK